MNAAYTNQLRDLSTVELLDAANRVRELEGLPGWTLIRGLLDVQVERLQARMLSASLPSYEQMAALAGELRGLQAMRDAAETVLAYAEERAAQERQALEARQEG
jgi:hypothetical protein